MILQLVREGIEGIEPRLQLCPAKCGYRQFYKFRNPMAQRRIGFGKGLPGPRPGGAHGIGQAPMPGHGLARPGRAIAHGRHVTDRKHKIHLRGAGKLISGKGFRIERCRFMPILLQHLQRFRGNLAACLCARGMCDKLARAQIAQQGLRHDGARGIARAEE